VVSEFSLTGSGRHKLSEPAVEQFSEAVEVGSSKRPQTDPQLGTLNWLLLSDVVDRLLLGNS